MNNEKFQVGLLLFVLFLVFSSVYTTILSGSSFFSQTQVLGESTFKNIFQFSPGIGNSSSLRTVTPYARPTGNIRPTGFSAGGMGACESMIKIKANLVELINKIDSTCPAATSTAP